MFTIKLLREVEEQFLNGAVSFISALLLNVRDFVVDVEASFCEERNQRRHSLVQDQGAGA